MLRIGVTTQTADEEIANHIKLSDLQTPKTVLYACLSNEVAPMVFPYTDDVKMIDTMLEGVDGVIVTGGKDVCPSFYGEKPLKNQKLDVSKPRDLFEIKVIKEAHRLKKPLLGICRGSQIVNVAFGGTVYQDINTEDADRPNPVQHRQKEPSKVKTHEVTITDKDSMIYHTLGTTHLKVNSLHHQAVDKVGKGLHVVAKAPDGITEALESDDHLVQVTQWHPEELCPYDSKQMQIFTDFFKRCK